MSSVCLPNHETSTRYQMEPDKRRCVCATIRCHTDASPGNPTITQVTRPVLHAEGPHWDQERQLLWFVDINGQSINCYQPSNGRLTSAPIDGLVTFVIPVAGTELLMAGLDRDLVYVKWTGDEKRALTPAILTSVDYEDEEKKKNRFNDAKADASGRLWAGTMGYEVRGVVDPKKGSLYSLDPASNDAEKHLTNIDISNGLAWNADNTVFYYIDSLTYRVDAFDFNMREGTIANRRPVFHLSNYNLTGIPDGMTIDSDGNLWVALFNGHKVIKVDPATGQLLQELEMPARDVTSVTFGGPDLDILYVTTSRKDLSPLDAENQPGAGAVFAVRGLGVRGAKTGNNNIVRLGM